MAQLMPLPLTISCFSRIQIGFTFLVLADVGCAGKRAVKLACVCVVCVLCVCVCLTYIVILLFLFYRNFFELLLSFVHCAGVIVFYL